MKNLPFVSVCTARGFIPLEVSQVTLAFATGLPLESRTVPVIVAPVFFWVCALTPCEKRTAMPSIRGKISLRLMGHTLLCEPFQCSAFPQFRFAHLAVCDAVRNCLAVQSSPPAAHPYILNCWN